MRENKTTLLTEENKTLCPNNSNIEKCKCNYAKNQEIEKENLLKDSKVNSKSYQNDTVEDIKELKSHIVDSVNNKSPIKPINIFISQYNKGDNSLNIIAFFDYYDGSETLEYHSPKSNRKELKLAEGFIRFKSKIVNDIKSEIEKIHKFDILTVDLHFSSSKDENTYEGLIDFYKTTAKEELIV